MPSSSNRFLTLRNGPTLPVDLLRLVWDLEARGCRFELENDHVFIRPRDRITEQDMPTLKRYRLHLRALLEYLERPDLDAHLRRVQ